MTYGKGFYFSTMKEYARIYSEDKQHILEVDINANLMVLDGDFSPTVSKDKKRIQKLRREAIAKGYDGFIKTKGDETEVILFSSSPIQYITRID
jgi:hypothetical protein